jgi:hypothetical protein
MVFMCGLQSEHSLYSVVVCIGGTWVLLWRSHAWVVDC